MIKFETGKTYRTHSLGDYECQLDYKIISRTAKTLKSFDQMDNRIKTYRISIWEGVEQFKPWGSFSMCPIMSADKLLEEITA